MSLDKLLLGAPLALIIEIGKLIKLFRSDPDPVELAKDIVAETAHRMARRAAINKALEATRKGKVIVRSGIDKVKK